MNVFELFAKLGLDTSEYDQGLDESEKKASGFGSKLGSALSTGTKIIGAGLAATSGAAVTMVKTSVDAYADYEQLVGGVETLFGDSAETVLANSEVAFRTAGLSMNEYMETSIQSAAALINSLGGDTEQAAALMDMSITDMADNVNKMGTTMEAVQNAYRGFSRGNFTMLDNLALGFAGTADGMGKLLEKAKEISGIEYDISSYSDIVEAIHVVQTEMGITGTTAKEAASTISGSVGSMKSAWTNLMTGLANGDADLGGLVDELVTSATTAFDNLLPVAEQALNGISDLVNTLLPEIISRIPVIISEVLPQLLTTGADILNSLVNGVTANLPMLVETALQIIVQLANGIAQSLPTLIPTIVNVVLEIANTLINNLDALLEAALAIIIGLAQGLIQALPQLIAKLPEIITGIIDFILGNIPLIIDAAIQIVMALVQALPEIISALIKAIPQIITGIIDAILNNIPLLVEAGINLFIALITALPEIIIEIVKAIPQIITGIVNGFKEAWPQIKEAGKNLLTTIVEGFTNVGTKIKDGVTKVWESIKNAFSEKIESAKAWGKDLIDNFVNGIKDKIQNVKDTVSNVANTIKDFLGFSEPEKGPLSNFHTYAPDMMKLFTEGIADNEDMLTDQIEKSFDFGDRTIKAVNNADAIEGGRSLSQEYLADAIREALEGFEIDWNGKNLGRLVQKYA